MLEPAANGWIENLARDELSDAYLFLRDVEHRVRWSRRAKAFAAQSPEGVAVIALMMGFAATTISRAPEAAVETVQGHYARLFESAPLLSSRAGNLVFTGDEDDPETLDTLERLGFANPKTVTEAVRGWHFGRFPAMARPRRASG